VPYLSASEVVIHYEEAQYRCMHLYHYQLPLTATSVQASTGVMLSAVVQVLLGCTGTIGILTRFIGPLTLCTSLAFIGLTLSQIIADQCGGHWGVAVL